MKSEEWSGSGLPPIGTVCEYLWQEGMKWRKCEVVAYYRSNTVAVDMEDCAAVFLHPTMFRPFKTPEQIAAEEREKAIADMYETVVKGVNIMYGVVALYDAGYRKTEVKK